MYNSVLFLSPSSSAILFHVVIDNVIPLTLKNPKTALYRLNKRAINYVSIYSRDNDFVQDLFDDSIDLLSNLNICHYNICVSIYIILLMYILIKNIQLRNKTNE